MSILQKIVKYMGSNGSSGKYQIQINKKDNLLIFGKSGTKKDLLSNEILRNYINLNIPIIYIDYKADIASQKMYEHQIAAVSKDKFMIKSSDEVDIKTLEEVFNKKKFLYINIDPMILSYEMHIESINRLFEAFNTFMDNKLKLIKNSSISMKTQMLTFLNVPFSQITERFYSLSSLTGNKLLAEQDFSLTNDPYYKYFTHYMFFSTPVSSQVESLNYNEFVYLKKDIDDIYIINLKQNPMWIKKLDEVEFRINEKA